ncbi:MAG TPA: alpha/beta fold hydrolase, partial [Pyrinomonadaceae bacterium]|nr:alpha/beta fold hydrolase [Pyrinomonadaceae bacterium]
PRLERAARAIRSKPFEPHPLFRGGHAQTIAASQHPGRLRDLRADRALYEQRHVEVERDTRVLVECRWQPERRDAPTLLVMHGLEGSADSLYVRGTARKAYAAGFNVACLNMRTCGGTEHLSPTLYHNGLTGDIHRVVAELTEGEGLSRLFLAGFSMSGNMMLRLAGEYGGEAPAALAGVCAVSPSIDLTACVERIGRPSNIIYEMSFMRHLRGRLRRKVRLQPGAYDLRGLWRVRTIRQFDERFTAPHGGFRDAADYYARTSSLPVIPRIRVPTLILHSVDDPLIPAEPFGTPAVIGNPSVLLVLTERGGHVGFYAGRAPEGEDRHWAENRVVEFCRLLARGNE